MKLSIVIPNFNGSRTLLRAIKSVLDQMPEDSEVMIVDDCSTDQSVELVKKTFPRVRIYQNKYNRGTAAVRNIGISQTKGDWILFVDADVILNTECILSLLTGANSADIIFPRIYYSNGKMMYPINEMQASYLMISPVFLIRRASLNRMAQPYFDEVYGTYCEDTDLFLRSYLAGLISSFRSNAEAIHDIDLRQRNRDSRYYLELRNALYGAIKFFGVKEIERFDHAFKVSNILRVFICGVLNFNFFDLQARGYRKFGGSKYNLSLLLSKHDHLSKRGSSFLITLSIKAIFWNVKNLPLSLKARGELIRRGVNSVYG